MGKLSTHIALTEAEAWMALIVACIHVDKKEMSVRESGLVGNLLVTVPALENGVGHAAFNKMYHLCREHGSYALIDGSFGLVSTDMRPTLFTHCVAACVVDGAWNDAKKKILYHIAHLLEIPAKFFSETVRVMLVYCRKNVAGIK